MGCEILGYSVDGRFHGGFVLVPAGGADIAVDFGELKGIHHAQHFVDVAPQRQVVDHLMAHDARFVDEEGTPQSDTWSEVKVVVFGDVFGNVGDERILDIADAAVLDRGVFPGQVGEVGVNGDADDFNVAAFELLEAVVEGNDLGGADKGEIEGIKKENDVLAFKAGQ
ncbi:MAG: signal peptide protein [Magnetococcales bacterium]|nr:signal peptide protein [Magnetococcales bacterium]